MEDEVYFMAMTDDATRACWVSVLKAKFEITECVIGVETSIGRETGINIKQYRSDDGPEYGTLAAHCASRGIIWNPRPRSVNQFNGFVDIKNHYLLEPVVAILLENKLPKSLWSWLIRGVNHTMNRLFHPEIAMTPHEAFYGRKPDISHLRALGCQCWYLVPEAERNPKFDPGMAEGRLVAYDFDGTYAIWDIQSKRIVHSRKIVFKEVSTPTILPEPSRHPEAQPWPEAASLQQRMQAVNNFGSIEFLTMALSTHYHWEFRFPLEE